MLIVDSNVWADFLGGAGGPHVERLDLALEEEEDIAILPIIITEVLQGFKTDRGFRLAAALLVSLPVIHPAVDVHVRAASLFRTLRGEGVTVRGAVDCVIAQTSIDSESTLLSPDADFERIAAHAPLRLWRRPEDST